MSSIFIKKLKGLSYEGKFGIRIILGFLFITCLTAFLHFREVLVEILEVNSKAPGYVVAQVDFEFPDPDATMILRQESIRDIGKFTEFPKVK